MPIRLEAGLPHQQKAIEAILNVFEDTERMKPLTNIQNPIIGLTEEKLKDNIRKIQQANIHPSMRNNMGISEYLNIDIKMETGTGKTYVYTQSMFALHEKYGFNKFIIVVPTLPIKAGTHQFIKADYVKTHFKDLYNAEIELNVLAPQKAKKGRQQFPSAIRNFVAGSRLVENKIHVLLVNGQMLMSKTMTRDDYHQMIENYDQPLVALQGTAPVLIIDEPHKFAKGNTTFKFILDNIKPQMIMRFGATFPENKGGKDYHNLVYNLGACEAFNENLVKSVGVEYLPGISESDEKVKLTSVVRNPWTAHFQCERPGQRKSHSLQVHDSLGVISENLHDVEITEIAGGKIVLSNDLILSVGDAIYPLVFGDTYQERMLKLAIKKHFETERANFIRRDKIKTLVLFFVTIQHN